MPIYRDHYWPAQSATRLYWQQEGPMFSYSLYVVCCLYVTFLLPPERAPKAGPCHLFVFKLWILLLLLLTDILEHIVLWFWNPKTQTLRVLGLMAL